MEEQKEEKKKFQKWPIIVVALLVILVIGATFAWFTLNLTGTKVNTIKAGSLSMVLDDEASDGILLQKAIPMSYQQGMNTTEYTFTLTNNGSKGDYTISLLDEATYTDSEGAQVTISSDKKIADTKIRYILLKDGEVAEASKSMLLSEAVNRVIDSGTIENGTTIRYSLRIWIDSKAENEVMGQIFNARLKLDATQHQEKVAGTEFSVGDYVKMTPTSTSYTLTTDMTGDDSDVVLNPSELNLWRVININDDQTIDLVSEYASSTGARFRGKQRYLDFVSLQNQIATQYENSKYTIGSRMIGYNGQTNKITDLSIIDSSELPWDNDTPDIVLKTDEEKGRGDTLYARDIELLEKANVPLSTSQVGISGNCGYWLASRYYNYDSETYWEYAGHYYYDYKGAPIRYIPIYFYNQGHFLDAGNLGNPIPFRPIVVLKSGVQASSGNGSSEVPYLLP